NEKLPEIIVATGLNFPDALAASAYAASSQIPILLVTASSIPKPTQDFLDEHADSNTTVDVVGGTAVALAPSSPAGIHIRRVAGNTRFDTAVAVATDLLGLTPNVADAGDELVLARGDDAGG